LWIKVSCGKIKEDPRYSPLLGYNNFPFPVMSQNELKDIETSSLELLAARESHADLSISNLYDPDKMPQDVIDAHKKLDTKVERLFSKKDFENDEERLELLFNKYEELTGGQNA
jgi:hypothetical protein